MRNTHCRSWDMARNLTIEENEYLNMLGTGIWRETLKNDKNDKCTLQDMTYGKNTDKQNEKLTWQELEYGKKH